MDNYNFATKCRARYVDQTVYSVISAYIWKETAERYITTAFRFPSVAYDELAKAD